MMSRASLLRIAVVAIVALGIALKAGREQPLPASVSEPVAQAAPRTQTPTPEPDAKPPHDAPRKPADDPFAPRGWLAASPQPAPAPAPVVQQAAAVVEPVVPATPTIPALPYSFMGKFEDGGRLVVYLSRGEQSYVVTAGETVEGTYKVLKVDGNQIEFEHLPSGTRQVLTIPPANN